MSENKSVTPSSKSPEYFFDISSAQLLVGRTALENHLEVGGHPSDLLDFSNANGWSREQLLYFGESALTLLGLVTGDSRVTFNLSTDYTNTEQGHRPESTLMNSVASQIFIEKVASRTPIVETYLMVGRQRIL